MRSHTDGRNVAVHVADSGPGIPDELRDKIFDPFFTTSPDGSAIGLSIAERIIADHNGTIRVGDSDLGGADFKIVLPIEKRMTPR